VKREIKIGTTTKQQMFLMVFDLNGVLCKSVKNKEFHVRPELPEFFRFMHESDMRYAFWTSKTPKNGLRMVSAIKSVVGEIDPLFTWFSDKCTPDPTEDDPHRVIKDLRYIWAEFSQYDVQNTFLVDDSCEKAGQFRKTNLIEVPAYNLNIQDTVISNLQAHISDLLLKHSDYNSKYISPSRYSLIEKSSKPPL